MDVIFEKTDLYEDIKGAALDNLECNKDVLKLPVAQAITYYQNEMEGIFEDNELERILTYIPIGVFSFQNNYFDKKIVQQVQYAIKELESTNHDELLEDEEKSQILIDIAILKKYL